MKKTLSILLLSALGASVLVGCGPKDDAFPPDAAVSKPPPPGKQSEANQETVAPNSAD